MSAKKLSEILAWFSNCHLIDFWKKAYPLEATRVKGGIFLSFTFNWQIYVRTFGLYWIIFIFLQKVALVLEYAFFKFDDLLVKNFQSLNFAPLRIKVKPGPWDACKGSKIMSILFSLDSILYQDFQKKPFRIEPITWKHQFEFSTYKKWFKFPNSSTKKDWNWKKRLKALQFGP